VLLAVVDAVSGETNLKTAAEARKQVILADRLVISKSDLAGAAEVEFLIRHLQELNPRAAIDVAIAGALAADRLIAPATAERSSLENNPKLAYASAEMAMKGIPNGSPDYLRAQDIAMVSRAELAKKDKKYRDQKELSE